MRLRSRLGPLKKKYTLKPIQSSSLNTTYVDPKKMLAIAAGRQKNPPQQPQHHDVDESRPIFKMQTFSRNEPGKSLCRLTFASPSEDQGLLPFPEKRGFFETNHGHALHWASKEDLRGTSKPLLSTFVCVWINNCKIYLGNLFCGFLVIGRRWGDCLSLYLLRSSYPLAHEAPHRRIQ